MSKNSGLWRRASKAGIAGSQLTFLSSTDLLLHLIDHAVYDHEFNNGPLLLSDVGYLLHTQMVDWPLFWSLAKQGNRTKGCALVLNMGKRYWGCKSIEYPADARTASQSINALADSAALLLLQNLEAPADMTLAAQLRAATTISKKIRYLVGKFFVPRSIVATVYPVRADSWRIFLWYPVLWRIKLLERLPSLLHSLESSEFNCESQELGRIKRWLQDGPGGSHQR